jgi:hypothetical protein
MRSRRFVVPAALLMVGLAWACGSGGSSTAGDSGVSHLGDASKGSGTGSASSGGTTTTGSSSGTSTSTSTTSGTSGASSTSSSSGGTTFPAGTICNKSGTPLTPPVTLQHVIILMFENEDFGSVNGNSSAPYISSLAAECGYASNYLDNCFADNLESLPHYLALSSGSNCNTGLDTTGTGCISVDEDATAGHLSTQSIYGQVSSWKAYQEDMPSNCGQSTSGNYAPKHNPPAYYTALSSCSTNDIPIAAVTCNASNTMTACGTPSNALTEDLANDTLPALAFVTPNLNNDMHNGTVQEGDNWLFTYMPLILQSAAYLRGEVAVFILWDEQSTLTSGGPTPNVFVSPYIKAGTVASTTLNHFSALRAVENALGITTYLGCASGMQPGGGACPTGSTADLRSALNL